MSPPATVAEVAASAQEEARRAAVAAGIRIVPLETIGEVRRVVSLIGVVWGEGDVPPPNLLRALARAGAVLLAAETLDSAPPGDSIVGFAFGFLGWRGGLHLHSHQVAVHPQARSHGIGYALKLAQRAACLDRGVSECRWTFDPLLAGNARFNFARLGARAVAFLPDCYGRMGDAINGDDASDRFEVSWQLDRPVPRSVVAPGAPLVAVDAEGYPRRTAGAVGPGVTVTVPPDYHRLRATGDPRGPAWRSVSRAAFADCFAAGLVADAFGPSGYRFVTDRAA